MVKTSIFIFMAGDNNLDVSGIQDIREMLQTELSHDINVIVQFDRRKAMPWEDPSERTTKRFQVKNHELITLQDIGETNTGDPSVLRNFLDWGIGNHPADRNMVIIWNHGGGIKDTDIYKSIGQKVKSSLFVPPKDRTTTTFDRQKNKTIDIAGMEKIDELLNVPEKWICTDDTSRDFLDNFELKSALSIPAKKLDIVAFDACLMNIYEIMYQLKDQTDFIIGSQEIEPPEGWPYKLVLDYLSSDPSVSNRNLPAKVVELYKESYADKGKQVTQSAIATILIEESASNLNSFAKSLLDVLQLIKRDLYEILSSCQRFRERDYMDLYDFATLCKNNITINAITLSASQLLSSLDKIIIANSILGDKVENAHGISIYFPLERPDAETMEMYSKLDFTLKYNYWFKLITSFHKPKALKRD
ncbi:hypothetical protein C5S29_05750 [ANME-1 cluster archaeon GoMg3.2]|nr:hypothetical protein [ANME-1 cluster archaeon GoMg3.2]